MTRDFFDRPVLTVARELLGRTIVHEGPGGRVAVRLTEVEAYDGPNDPGSHAYRGRTARNEVMFGTPGHVYVYFTYGMHYCANFVCGPGGHPSAVLLRAGEVVEGIEIARARRSNAASDRELARGPARLVTALGLGPSDNGADACGEGTISVLRGVEDDGNPGLGQGVSPERIRTGPRVGLSAAPDWPWRFWLDGDPTVSVYRPAKPRRVAAATTATAAATTAPPAQTL